MLHQRVPKVVVPRLFFSIFRFVRKRKGNNINHECLSSLIKRKKKKKEVTFLRIQLVTRTVGMNSHLGVDNFF